MKKWWLVKTLGMLLITLHAVEADDWGGYRLPDNESVDEVWGTIVQDWCQNARQAKDEGELQAIEFLMSNSQGMYIKLMKQDYEAWQKARAKVEQQKAKVQELMAQVSVERTKLVEGSRIPTLKEKELEGALYGVRREIMQLSGLMGRVHDLYSALEASQSAGRIGQFDDRSLEELQAQLGRARAEVASFEREHGEIMTLNQQLANFANELESERLNAKVPNTSRLKDLENQLDEESMELGADITAVKGLHAEVNTMIAKNLGFEEMLKWIRVCIDGRRQQLAARSKPPQGDLRALTACETQQGPFGCTGVIYGGSFKMICHNLNDDTNTTREGEAVFRFQPDGTVGVEFFVPNFKGGKVAGGLGAGKIASQGSVELDISMWRATDDFFGSEAQSWKGQFSLQPMDGGKIGPVGNGTLKLVYRLGYDVTPHAVCEGDFSLGIKKE